jgi:hypothetical protein
MSVGIAISHIDTNLKICFRIGLIFLFPRHGKAGGSHRVIYDISNM